MTPSVPTPKTCNYCNTPDLHWGKNKNNKWWLFDENNASHQCSKVKATQNTHNVVNAEGRVVTSPDPNIARRPAIDPSRKKTPAELRAEFNQIQKDT